MIKNLKHNIKNEANNPFINLHRQPDEQLEKYEIADKMLRMNEESLKDWRRNIARIRASRLLSANNAI